MEQEYNWKAIFSGAMPVSIAMVFVFLSGLSRNMKWFYLVIGLFISMGITYYFDKKRHNIYTAPFVVVIIALIVYAIKGLGFI